MLDRLSPRPGARERGKRVGRGPGSGIGKTSGRGVKGQGKRSSGAPTKLRFEGGQMPMVRRLPKRGFKRDRSVAEVVNLADLAGFAAGATVDAAALRAKGLIRGRAGKPVKLLAGGDAPSQLVVRVDRVSAAARAKIEAAGGRIEATSGAPVEAAS
jgi:large subunit ribosomal protein L15